MSQINNNDNKKEVEVINNTKTEGVKLDNEDKNSKSVVGNKVVSGNFDIRKAVHNELKEGDFNLLMRYIDEIKLENAHDKSSFQKKKNELGKIGFSHDTVIDEHFKSSEFGINLVYIENNNELAFVKDKYTRNYNTIKNDIDVILRGRLVKEGSKKKVFTTKELNIYNKLGKSLVALSDKFLKIIKNFLLEKYALVFKKKENLDNFVNECVKLQKIILESYDMSFKEQSFRDKENIKIVNKEVKEYRSQQLIEESEKIKDSKLVVFEGEDKVEKKILDTSVPLNKKKLKVKVVDGSSVIKRDSDKAKTKVEIVSNSETEIEKSKSKVEVKKDVVLKVNITDTVAEEPIQGKGSLNLRTKKIYTLDVTDDIMSVNIVSVDHIVVPDEATMILHQALYEVEDAGEEDNKLIAPILDGAIKVLYAANKAKESRASGFRVNFIKNNATLKKTNINKFKESLKNAVKNYELENDKIYKRALYEERKNFIDFNHSSVADRAKIDTGVTFKQFIAYLLYLSRLSNYVDRAKKFTDVFKKKQTKKFESFKTKLLAVLADKNKKLESDKVKGRNGLFLYKNLTFDMFVGYKLCLVDSKDVIIDFFADASNVYKYLEFSKFIHERFRDNKFLIKDVCEHWEKLDIYLPGGIKSVAFIPKINVPTYFMTIYNSFKSLDYGMIKVQVINALTVVNDEVVLLLHSWVYRLLRSFAPYLVTGFTVRSGSKPYAYKGKTIMEKNAAVPYLVLVNFDYKKVGVNLIDGHGGITALVDFVHTCLIVLKAIVVNESKQYVAWLKLKDLQCFKDVFPCVRRKHQGNNESKGKTVSLIYIPTKPVISGYEFKNLVKLQGYGSYVSSLKAFKQSKTKNKIHLTWVDGYKNDDSTSDTLDTIVKSMKDGDIVGMKNHEDEGDDVINVEDEDEQYKEKIKQKLEEQKNLDNQNVSTNVRNDGKKYAKSSNVEDKSDKSKKNLKGKKNKNKDNKDLKVEKANALRDMGNKLNNILDTIQPKKIEEFENDESLVKDEDDDDDKVSEEDIVKRLEQTFGKVDDLKLNTFKKYESPKVNILFGVANSVLNAFKKEIKYLDADKVNEDNVLNDITNYLISTKLRYPYDITVVLSDMDESSDLSVDSLLILEKFLTSTALTEISGENDVMMMNYLHLLCFDITKFKISGVINVCHSRYLRHLRVLGRVDNRTRYVYNAFDLQSVLSGKNGVTKQVFDKSSDVKEIPIISQEEFEEDDDDGFLENTAFVPPKLEIKKSIFDEEEEIITDVDLDSVDMQLWEAERLGLLFYYDEVLSVQKQINLMVEFDNKGKIEYSLRRIVDDGNSVTYGANQKEIDFVNGYKVVASKKSDEVSLERFFRMCSEDDLSFLADNSLVFKFLFKKDLELDALNSIIPNTPIDGSQIIRVRENVVNMSYIKKIFNALNWDNFLAVMKGLLYRTNSRSYSVNESSLLNNILKPIIAFFDVILSFIPGYSFLYQIIKTIIMIIGAVTDLLNCETSGEIIFKLKKIFTPMNIIMTLLEAVLSIVASFSLIGQIFAIVYRSVKFITYFLESSKNIYFDHIMTHAQENYIIEDLDNNILDKYCIIAEEKKYINLTINKITNESFNIPLPIDTSNMINIKLVFKSDSAFTGMDGVSIYESFQTMSLLHIIKSRNLKQVMIGGDYHPVLLDIKGVYKVDDVMHKVKTIVHFGLVKTLSVLRSFKDRNVIFVFPYLASVSGTNSFQKFNGTFKSTYLSATNVVIDGKGASTGNRYNYEQVVMCGKCSFSNIGFMLARHEQFGEMFIQEYSQTKNGFIGSIIVSPNSYGELNVSCGGYRKLINIELDLYNNLMSIQSSAKINKKVVSDAITNYYTKKEGDVVSFKDDFQNSGFINEITDILYDGSFHVTVKDKIQFKATVLVYSTAVCEDMMKCRNEFIEKRGYIRRIVNDTDLVFKFDDFKGYSIVDYSNKNKYNYYSENVLIVLNEKLPSINIAVVKNNLVISSKGITKENKELIIKGYEEGYPANIYMHVNNGRSSMLYPYLENGKKNYCMKHDNPNWLNIDTDNYDSNTQMLTCYINKAAIVTEDIIYLCFKNKERHEKLVIAYAGHAIFVLNSNVVHNFLSRSKVLGYKFEDIKNYSTVLNGIVGKKVNNEVVRLNCELALHNVKDIMYTYPKVNNNVKTVFEYFYYSAKDLLHSISVVRSYDDLIKNNKPIEYSRDISIKYADKLIIKEKIAGSDWSVNDETIPIINETQFLKSNVKGVYIKHSTLALKINYGAILFLNRLCLDKNWLFNYVDSIHNSKMVIVNNNGVPGCGKSFRIKKLFDKKDIILCPGVDQKKDYLKSIVKLGLSVSDLKLRVRTYAGITKNLKQYKGFGIDRNKPINILYCDEYTKYHFGNLLYVANYLKAKTLDISGDPKQIGVIVRIPDVVLNFSAPDVNNIVYHVETWRCGYNTCRLIIYLKFYNIFICKSNIQNDVIRLVKINSVKDIPKNATDLLMCFSQEEKKVLKDYNRLVKTVDESQGDTHDEVFVAFLYTQNSVLYQMITHWIVCSTRHRKKITFFYISEVGYISKIKDFLNGVSSKFKEVVKFSGARHYYF